jgi:MipA family protein
MGAHHSRDRYDSKFAKVLLLVVLAGVTPARGAAAEADCKGPSEDCVPIGGWNFSVGLGAGVRTNPLVNGKDIPLVVIPQVSFYGKRFFLDNLDAGFTLKETAANTFNLIASPGYDRVYFYRTDLQNFFITGFSGNGLVSYTPDPAIASAVPGAIKVPPAPRRITYLAGPEWTFKFDRVSGQLDALHEVTGHNHGDEIRAALAIPLLESKGALSANIGVTWKSAAIVNYYYGVYGVYEGRSALDPFVKLGYTVPLSGKWRFNAFAEYERLADAIANSPIVAEHSVATVFIGAIYKF